MNDEAAGSLLNAPSLHDDDWNTPHMMTPTPQAPNVQQEDAANTARLQESINSLQRAFEAAMSSRHSNAPPQDTVDPWHPSVPFQAQTPPHAANTRGPQVTWTQRPQTENRNSPQTRESSGSISLAPGAQQQRSTALNPNGQSHLRTAPSGGNQSSIF